MTVLSLAAGVAAMVELMAEPFCILATAQLHFKYVTITDTAATVARSLLTAALLVRNASAHKSVAPATVFGAAQLAYALVVLTSYVVYGLRALPQVILAGFGWKVWLDS